MCSAAVSQVRVLVRVGTHFPAGGGAWDDSSLLFMVDSQEGVVAVRRPDSTHLSQGGWVPDATGTNSFIDSAIHHSPRASPFLPMTFNIGLPHRTAHGHGQKYRLRKYGSGWTDEGTGLDWAGLQ